MIGIESFRYERSFRSGGARFLRGFALTPDPSPAAWERGRG